MCCADRIKSFSEDEFQYFHFDLVDSKDFNVVDYLVISSRMLDYIIDEKKSKILVHCDKGESRSACIILGFLMMKNHLNFDSALTYLKLKRPSINLANFEV